MTTQSHMEVQNPSLLDAFHLGDPLCWLYEVQVKICSTLKPVARLLWEPPFGWSGGETTRNTIILGGPQKIDICANFITHQPLHQVEVAQLEVPVAEVGSGDSSSSKSV